MPRKIDLRWGDIIPDEPIWFSLDDIKVNLLCNILSVNDTEQIEAVGSEVRHIVDIYIYI